MDETGKIIARKERVIYEGKPKYSAYLLQMIIGSIIFGVIIGVIIGLVFKTTLMAVFLGILASILGIILGHLYYSKLYYAITDSRIIIQSGIIGRDFKSIDYAKIQNASVNVGIIGVIMKVGTIKLFTGEIMGGNKSMHPKYDEIKHVEHPYEIMRKLQTHITSRKGRR